MGSEKLANNLKFQGKLDFLFTDPNLTEEETINKCQSALQFGPASVWVKACYVQSVVAYLRSEKTEVGTAIGCRDGSNTTQIKVAEAKRALTEGATILATAVNVGFVREQRNAGLLADLNAIAGIAHMNGALMEVIIDPELLEENEVLKTAQLVGVSDIDILSLPINWENGAWDFSRYDFIREEVGKSVQFKGFVQWRDAADWQKLIEKGIARVGIKSFDK